MRFYLDNDVDYACKRVIEKAGHFAWHASDAGRSASSDPNQTDYAQRRGAAFVTHDRRYTNIVRRNIRTQHIRLRVDHPFGPGLLQLHLEDIVPLIERHRELLVEISFTKLHATWPGGGRQTIVFKPPTS